MHSYHRPRRIQYALGLCFVAFGGLVRAQGTVPNSNQTQIPQCSFPSPLSPAPCPLLVSVMTSCADADNSRFVLLSLNSVSLGIYPGPDANTTALEQCQCTDVAYNLYSACAACQINDPSHWLNRDGWFSGCTANTDETQIASAPAKMAPDDISLWMTQKYIPTFSPSEALAVFMSGTPLSTLESGTLLPTTPGTPSTRTMSAGSGISSNAVNGSAASSNQNSFGSTTNTTPIIVGAVVGAFVLLAILALGIFFLRRRQKQRTAPSAEFMKYSQVNAGSAREPLRARSPPTTADKDMNIGQGGYTRHSAIRLDSAGSGEDGGDIEMTEGGTNPPPFTPGLFKDPIFEKGVALNLAGAGSGGGVGGSGAYGNSPITYSPATPSTQAHIATQFSERHGLIHGRQDTL